MFEKEQENIKMLERWQEMAKNDKEEIEIWKKSGQKMLKIATKYGQVFPEYPNK